jgi:hypothetical protein
VTCGIAEVQVGEMEQRQRALRSRHAVRDGSLPDRELLSPPIPGPLLTKCWPRRSTPLLPPRPRSHAYLIAGEPARADPANSNPPEVEAAFQAAPPEMTAEILDGELHLTPRPPPLHARTSSRLGARLDGPFDAGEGGPGGWVILDGPELHLGPKPDKIVPDLAG